MTCISALWKNKAYNSGLLKNLIFILVSTWWLTGCAPGMTATHKGPKSDNLEDTTKQALMREYRIGVGDVLQISVWRNEDLSTEVTVLPDGNISVSLLGEVKAAGQTTEDLRYQISKTLEAYIRDPKVTVTVANAVSAEYLQRVRITGAVLTPLSIPYRRGLTVLDLVLLAGGVTTFADADDALLYRHTKFGLEVYAIHLDDILNNGDLETNYQLLPSDIITVPGGRL